MWCVISFTWITDVDDYCDRKKTSDKIFLVSFSLPLFCVSSFPF